LSFVLSTVVALISAGTAYGLLKGKLDRMASELGNKIERAEFDQGMKRLDELHKDLREIRDLLMQVLGQRVGP
jgi:hypothetical protein